MTAPHYVCARDCKQGCRARAEPSLPPHCKAADVVELMVAKGWWWAPPALRHLLEYAFRCVPEAGRGVVGPIRYEVEKGVVGRGKKARDEWEASWYPAQVGRLTVEQYLLVYWWRYREHCQKAGQQNPDWRSGILYRPHMCVQLDFCLLTLADLEALYVLQALDDDRAPWEGVP